MMRGRARRPPLLFLVLVMVLTAGCGTVATGRFDLLAQASHAVLQGSSETYTRIEKLERRYMVFKPAAGPLTVATFKPVIQDEQGRARDFDFGPRMRFRESALEVLTAYADTLQAFARRDFQGDLDRASQNLAASVSRLTQDVIKEPETSRAAGILATAVNALGRTIVEREQREALRRTMDTAQVGVAMLAQRIPVDNSEIGLAVRVMRDGILGAANRMRPPEHTVARLEFDGDMALLIAETEEIFENLNSLNAAIAALPAAYADVRQSLDTERPRLERLQGLVAEAKRISKFYRTLQ